MRRIFAVVLIGSLAGCGAINQAKDSAEKAATKAAVNVGCKGVSAAVKRSGGSPSQQIGQAVGIIKPNVQQLRSSNPELATQADEFISALDGARTDAQKAAEAEAAGSPDAAQLRADTQTKVTEARRVANEYGFGDCATALDIPLN